MTEVYVTVLTGIGILIGIWRINESMFKDVTEELRSLNGRIDKLYKLIIDDQIPPSQKTN